MEVLIALISGGAVVAVIEGIKEALRFRREQKAKKSNENVLNTQEWRKSTDKKLDNLTEGLRYVLYDRIRYLAQSYIAEGCVDFDDRRILNLMHQSYHAGLDGNGDLDNLMGEVNHLPLKRG
jgi:hypothetical protein